MYLRLILSLFTIGLLQLQTIAQNELPKGFSKGAITINNQVKTGFVKADFKNTGCIEFIEEGAKKKTKFSGMDLERFEIDSIQYISIKGDIFKVISGGNLYLLQKQTQVAGKPYYNGLETVMMEGAEGRLGDYFLFLGKQKKLKLVSTKTNTQVIAEMFAGSNAAIEKAGQVEGDWSQLKEAVAIYNSQNN
jgi:hypothetical protein